MTVDRSSQRWVLSVVAAGSLMVALNTLVVSTALTTIKGDLGAAVEELEWTINAYNLTLAVLLLPAAALGDRFGRRRMFATGLGLFIAASAACAVSPSVEALIAARAVQGAGGALVGTLSFALVSAAFPPERQGAAIGALDGIVGASAVGEASGANGMLRELGGVFGLAVAVAVFVSVGSYGSAAAFTDGLAPALGVACAFALAGAIAGVLVPGRRASEKPAGAEPQPSSTPTATPVRFEGAQDESSERRVTPGVGDGSQGAACQGEGGHAGARRAER